MRGALAAGVVVVLAAGCGGGGGEASSVNTAAAGRPRFAAKISIGHPSPVSPVMVDEEGRALYVDGRDRANSGATACYGACAKVWLPIVTVAPPQPFPGFHVDASKLGTMARRGGSTQVTYAGYPLYRFHTEGTATAEHVGQRSFGTTWYPLHPDGRKAE